MLAIERKSEILAILQREKSVLVAELSQKYNVTEETIRRDLDKLEKEGYVKKTYGGAVLSKNTSMEMPFKVRAKTNKQEKQTIARLVQGTIEEGESIMLDSSTTSLMVARNLKQYKNLTVITNSVEILLELSDCKGIKVISTGGELRDSALSLGGRQAEQMLERYNVDKAVLSCKGVSMEKGITDSNEPEAHIKGTMRECAKTTIWAIDSTKFDNVSFVQLAKFQKGDIVVTDKPLEQRWQEFFQDHAIQVVAYRKSDKVID
ncbi:MAG: DeoR/GlpR transcriptional regulator [Lachnospiraceae bacterium]|nr:DeoR/GlpR transcriptional regulator [Lachnospiraceae bacterium]